MNYLNDFHLQNRRFISGFTADDLGCISLVKSRMRESRTSRSVRGCSCERGQSTRPAMRNRTTLLRAEHGLTAPFLRLAGRLKLHITFEMDDRRILMGLVYPVRFGGFCRAGIITWNGKEGNPLNECTLCRSG